MGRGLVDPIDDFRATNPPTIPEALDVLAKELRRQDYRVKPVLRLILTSHTYQMSSENMAVSSEADEVPWARTEPRPLPAEVLLDACAQVLDVPLHLSGQPVGVRAGQVPGVQPSRSRGLSEANRFLLVFGKPQRLLTCECERGSEPTLNQAFQLLSGPALQQMLTHPGNQIDRWLAAKINTDAIVTEAFLLALCRPPTQTEHAAAVAMINAARDHRPSLEDFLAGLFSSKAFLLRE